MIGRLIVAIGYIGAVFATPAYADSFKDRWEKMPPPAFTSQKSVAALEFCLAVGVGQWMPPATIPGEGQALIYSDPDTDGFQSIVFMMMLVKDAGSERTIAYNAHKAWDDRTEHLIRSCI